MGLVGGASTPSLSAGERETRGIIGQRNISLRKQQCQERRGRCSRGVLFNLLYLLLPPSRCFKTRTSFTAFWADAALIIDQASLRQTRSIAVDSAQPTICSNQRDFLDRSQQRS